jgi:hypothetical protein
MRVIDWIKGDTLRANHRSSFVGHVDVDGSYSLFVILGENKARSTRADTSLSYFSLFSLSLSLSLSRVQLSQQQQR